MIGRHAVLGNVWNVGVAAWREKIGERNDCRVLRQSMLAEQRAEFVGDGITVFARIHLPSEGNFKTSTIEFAHTLPGFLKTPAATTGIVSRRIGIVDTDAEGDWVRLRGQRLDLPQSLEDRLGAVGQNQAGFQCRRVAQNVDEVFDDERFATGKRELLYADRGGFVEQRPGVVKRNPVEASISWFRALQTERACEITRRAGMEPQLPELSGIDITASLCVRGEE